MKEADMFTAEIQMVPDVPYVCPLCHKLPEVKSGNFFSASFGKDRMECSCGMCGPWAPQGRNIHVAAVAWNRVIRKLVDNPRTRYDTPRTRYD